MFFKKMKTNAAIFFLTFFIFPINLLAYSNKIYAGGDNIGIEISMNGVLVVGTYKINGEDQAKKAGLKEGDIIVKVNDEKVSSIDEMIDKLEDNEVKITYKRNNKESDIMLPITKEENIYKTGLYVKDSISGIGTLTFIDPTTKKFGALGHEILDAKTGLMLEVKNGNIYKSTVTSIDRSTSGNPGSKNATLESTILGDIKENSEEGLFGKYLDDIKDKTLYEVATIDKIKPGKASILTVTEEKKIKSYEIEILKVDASNKNLKNMLFEVKDKELLEKTGGIVQGMSGSPIIQDNYIIGAVTHVVVNNPKRGYGIFITNMLEEMERD